MLRPQTRPVSHFCTSIRSQPLHEGTGLVGPWALQLSCLLLVIPNHGCVSHPPPPPTPPPRACSRCSIPACEVKDSYCLLGIS